jgi:hypothetical protein
MYSVCIAKGYSIPTLLFYFISVKAVILDFQVTEDSTTPIPEHKVFNSVVDSELFSPDPDFISKVIPDPDLDPTLKLRP